MWMHASFCRELIILSGACVWSLDAYFNLSPINHLYVLFVQMSYQAIFFSSNIISCNFIYNANGIFKLWEFYRSRPSARNKQSVHIVSFPAGRTHSCPSARHTTIYRKAFGYVYWKCDMQKTTTCISYLLFLDGPSWRSNEWLKDTHWRPWRNRLPSKAKRNRKQTHMKSCYKWWRSQYT